MYEGHQFWSGDEPQIAVTIGAPSAAEAGWRHRLPAVARGAKTPAACAGEPLCTTQKDTARASTAPNLAILDMTRALSAAAGCRFRGGDWYGIDESCRGRSGPDSCVTFTLFLPLSADGSQ